MFVTNTGAYSIEEHFWCSTLGLAPGLAHKEQTKMEWLATDERSSL